ncbi:MAG TPA: DUF4340 domain-containing protein [Candidatus Hydrogenedentes bacterium]|mgnify:CR=1 FL=1|nr:DUF4340 domain-containing protein [Candidatus Hydrogenedentota bacterium]HPC15494.1 DUF4340 domain-containing protein [Candidatus Hydrogenedentota bacterium]HRT20229.1 DUF4340 domain-containing protein [Candidatus Hydrogenedentota bacterium]HRT64291.1 DUF4340 domain-containing protein [Candidatus Hydrogenedentota bacterium]
MNFKTTGLLLTVLIVLGIAYWGMTRYETGRQVRREEVKRLFSFGPEALREIEVRRIGETPVVASHSPDGTWTIVKPHDQIRPNVVVWDRLAAALAALANERTIAKDTSDLAKYALDKPVLSIAAKTASGESLEIAFGAVEPTQTFRYALTGDGVVFLAAQKAFQEMDRPLSLLRDPYVLALGKDEIVRIEFARFWTGVATGESKNHPEPGQESVVVVVEKSDDGLWKMTSPIEAVANQEALNELVKYVQFATAQKYVEEPKALDSYGLDPPKARITLQPAGKAPQTLLVGALESTGDEKKAGGLFAKNAAYPAVFVMDPGLLNLLPRTPDAFREARMLSHPLLDVEAIHYVAGATDITLRNDPDKGWLVTAPPGVNTDQVAVSHLLAAFKALQGRGFPGDPKPEFGLEKPIVEITFHLKNGLPPAVIRVGTPTADNTHYYAMQDNGCVTLLGQLDVAAITKPLFFFQKKDLMAFDVKEAARIAMTMDGTSYLFEKAHGQWIIQEPAGRTLDSQSDMGAMLKALSSVRADALESAEPPADPALYGLDAPAAAISVTLETDEGSSGGSTIGPLVVGKPAPDDSQQRFATSPFLPGVYRIPQSLLDEIRESLKNIRSLDS